MGVELGSWVPICDWVDVGDGEGIVAVGERVGCWVGVTPGPAQPTRSQRPRARRKVCIYKGRFTG